MKKKKKKERKKKKKKNFLPPVLDWASISLLRAFMRRAIMLST